MIKFYDIYRQDKHLHNVFIKELKKHFKKNDFILGDSVKKFENNFSKYTKSKFSVGCANGTDALYLAIKSLDLPENSEVIVPAMTWISTVLSINFLISLISTTLPYKLTGNITFVLEFIFFFI